MSLIIILAIFLVPIASIVTIKGTIVWYPQLLALQFMGGICYSSMFWKLNKFLAIFLGYLAFSYIYIANASPRTQMCLLIGYFAIAITLITSQIKDLKWIYIALIGMSLLSIAYAILQAFGIDPIFIAIHPGDRNVVSFMGSPNQLGLYSSANAFWSPWMIPLAIVPLFMAKCNSALIGLICGSTIFIWCLYGKKAVSIFILCVLILIIPWWHYNHKQNQEIMERFNLWKLSFQQINSGKIDSIDLSGNKSLIQGSPLTGFGLGNFFVYSPFSQYKMYGLTSTKIYIDGKHSWGMEHFYEHAHNDLVEALYEFGYIGLFILIFVIGSVGYVFMASNKSVGIVTAFSSLVAQSIASCSVYVFHAPVSLFMFCLTLGLFYAEVNNEKQATLKSITP